jgi:hypothetical protein
MIKHCKFKAKPTWFWALGYLFLIFSQLFRGNEFAGRKSLNQLGSAAWAYDVL